MVGDDQLWTIDVGLTHYAVRMLLLFPDATADSRETHQSFGAQLFGMQLIYCNDKIDNLNFKEIKRLLTTKNIVFMATSRVN